MAGEVLTGGRLFSLGRFDGLRVIVGLIRGHKITWAAQRWRNMHRAAHEAFNPRAARSYRTLQELEAYRLAARLLRSPETWKDPFEAYVWGHFLCPSSQAYHTCSSATSIILSILYSWHPDKVTKHEYFLSRIHEFGQNADEGIYAQRASSRYIPLYAPSSRVACSVEA